MTPWEYFQSGSWCMYLIAVSGIVLYTLLCERFLALHAMRRNGAQERIDPLSLQLLRSKYFLLIRSLIAVIPLLGLLGTVTGMMDSFAAMRLAHVDLGVGISQALVTTQYGLLLAAPALLIERYLQSGIERDERQAQLRALAEQQVAL